MAVSGKRQKETGSSPAHGFADLCESLLISQFVSTWHGVPQSGPADELDFHCLWLPTKLLISF